MKWTKVALVLAIPVMALLLLGQSVRPPVAEAKPTTIVTINWVLCLTLGTTIDWDNNQVIDAADAQKALFDCHASLSNQKTFDNMIGALRVIKGTQSERLAKVLEDPPTPEDLTQPGKDFNGDPRTPMDSDAGQVHQLDGQMWAIAFVSNDEPVAFYVDKGVFANGKSSIACGPGAPNADFYFTDPDCDNDPSTVGDGVVAALFAAGGADRGAATVRVRQGHIETDDQYTIVGEPSTIELTASKTAIQTGAPLCKLFSDTPSFLATLGSPVKSPLSSTVRDSDGTAITGALVKYDIVSDDIQKVARFTLPVAGTHEQESLTPTLSTALGINSPNIICGDENPATIKIKATIATDANGAGLDPEARERHMEVEMKVQGPPTNMVLSAAPSSLVCDGTATSAVSATLTDAAGNPAVDGNVVRFDVKALGTVSPIEAKSAGGVATTTLTPLTDIARGATVNATLLLPQLDEGEKDIPNVEDADDTEVLVPSDVLQAFLVECSAGAPQPAPGAAPSGSTGPNISPPLTGDGGYLSGE